MSVSTDIWTHIEATWDWGPNATLFVATENPDGRPLGYGDPRNKLLEAGDTTTVLEHDNVGDYGIHSLGYGHPFFGSWAAVIEGDRFENLGGDKVTIVTLPGTFPVGVDLTATINGIAAYSNIMGGGTDLTASSNGDRISFALPNLFTSLGATNVVVTGTGFTKTFTGILTVVRHVGRSGSTLVGTRFPRDVYDVPSYKRQD